MSNRMYRSYRKHSRLNRSAFCVPGCQVCGRPVGRHSRFNADYTRLCGICYRRSLASFVGQGVEL